MIGLDARPRALEPSDEARLVRHFRRLSADTVYRRFFTPIPTLDGRLLAALLAVDHDRHEALVITVGDEIIAVASYHRHADEPATADVAVMVEDGWQHHGVGRHLVRQLSRLAASRGVERLHADVLPDNRQAVALIRRMNRSPHARLDGGTLAYDLDLASAA